MSDWKTRAIKENPPTNSGWRSRAVVEQPKPEELPGLGRTVFDQSMQGATFGFSDEIQDRIGALIASRMTGEKYSDLLNLAREETKNRLQQQAEKRPVVSTIANIAGSIANPAILATAPKLLGSGLSVARGAGYGAGVGGLYGAGSAEEGERLGGAAMGGLIGGATGGAIPLAMKTPAAIKTLSTGARARSADELIELSNQVRVGSGALYKHARNAGVVLNNRLTKRLDQVITNRLSRDFSALDPRIQTKTTTFLSELKQKLASGQIGLDELDNEAKKFGYIIRDSLTLGGDVSSDGAAAAIVKDAINDVIRGVSGKDLIKGSPDAVKILKTARNNWMSQAKLDTVADLVYKAEADGGTALNYKNVFKNYYRSRKKMSGFNAQEREFFRKAATDDTGENVLRWMGTFGIGRNSALMPMLTGLGGVGAANTAIGGAAVIPAAGAIAIGTGARAAKNLTAKARIENLVKQIESGVIRNP